MAVKKKEQRVPPLKPGGWKDQHGDGYGPGNSYGSDEWYNEDDHKIWALTDEEVKAFIVKPPPTTKSSEWKIYKWMRDARRDILNLEVHCEIPHGDPRDPPSPPFD